MARFSWCIAIVLASTEAKSSNTSCAYNSVQYKCRHLMSNLIFKFLWTLSLSFLGCVRARGCQDAVLPKSFFGTPLAWCSKNGVCLDYCACSLYGVYCLVHVDLGSLALKGGKRHRLQENKLQPVSFGSGSFLLLSAAVACALAMAGAGGFDFALALALALGQCSGNASRSSSPAWVIQAWIICTSSSVRFEYSFSNSPDSLSSTISKALFASSVHFPFKTLTRHLPRRSRTLFLALLAAFSRLAAFAFSWWNGWT